MSEFKRRPNEIITIPGGKSFLCVSDCLCRGTDEAGNETGIDNRASRFEISIIRYQQEDKKSKTVTANMKSGNVVSGAAPDELCQLRRKYNELIRERDMRKLTALISGKASEDVPLSADTPIPMGKLKGKTPRELLTEGRRQDLMSHGSWLKSGLERYPKNKETLKDLQKIVRLFDEGKLTAASSRIQKILLSTDLKVKSSGRSKEDPSLKGTTKYYQMVIRYDDGLRKPFIFEITNKWGTTKSAGRDGQLTQLDKTVYMQTEVFMCDEELFNSILRHMEASWNYFMMRKRETQMKLFKESQEEYRKSITDSGTINSIAEAEEDDDFANAFYEDDEPAVSENFTASDTSESDFDDFMFDDEVSGTTTNSSDDSEGEEIFF